MPVEHGDLRKLMVSARIRSPALGMVTSHVEVERLFANFITSTQAEIALPDIERVSQHYGYNREFAKRCYEQLKRDRNKLGAKELWITLSHHLHELEPDIIKFISDQIAFPHLYRHPQERKGAKIYKSMDAIMNAQNMLPLNGKQESGHVILIKDLCLSYGKMIFSKKMKVSEWWRGFEPLATFSLQSNGFMANFKECCLCLADFIYKYGSHEKVEQKIARLVAEHVLHYKAYVGNPQSEVYMHVILAFARKVTSKTLSFFLGLLSNKFKEVKTNSKRCEIIAWTLMQLAPAVSKMNDGKQQQECIDLIGKFMTTVFREWRANNQGPTRHWTALAYHQLQKYDLHSNLKINEAVIQKAENALSVESWDADELTGGIFPIFEGSHDAYDEDRAKKKKKKKKRKKGNKESVEDSKKREERRQKQIKKGQQQQYKMYGAGDPVWSQMGQSMQSIMTMGPIGDAMGDDDDGDDAAGDTGHVMEDLDVNTKHALETFNRMKTAEGGDVYDPDRDVVNVNALENEMMDALSEIDPVQKRKEDEKKKLLSLKQKKFFLMDNEYLNAESNPYHQKIESELSAFKPLMEWDAAMIKEWIRTEHFSLNINDEIDDYFPDYMNGYMFLNLVRFPFDVLRRNLHESGTKWSDRFLNAMWVASKEFHTKYLLELGINRVGECCGQINALKIESHRLSHILQENDIVYDPDYAKQCVTQELIAPKFEQLLAEEDALHPRWTDSDAKQLKGLYLRLASKLEKETLDLIKNESKYYEAMRKTQIDLRELSTRVDLRYSDLENYNTQLTTQELMLRDLAVKSKHLTMEKNQLLNEYAAAVNEKNYYLRELHINGKLPYIEHLEKLKAEIQRQVDDVTLLDYQKDQVKQTEKDWIDLATILTDVFSKSADKDQEHFEDELRALVHAMGDTVDLDTASKQTDNDKGKDKKIKKKHRKGQKSTVRKGRNQHRRSHSINSISKNSIAPDEIDTTNTVHNREDNIDILCVIRKLFSYFIGEWEEKPQFLPVFNDMIDEWYDVDPNELHYDPVNIDEISLKRYVQAGKEAKMRELQLQKEEREMKENEATEFTQNTPPVEQLKDKVDAIKESLEQHTTQKGTEAQLKEMEKKVKIQQRRDRNKKLLEKTDPTPKTDEIKEERKDKEDVEDKKKEKDKEDASEAKTDKPEESKQETADEPIPPPPPAPFHEKLEGDDHDVVIVPPPPPPPPSASTLSAGSPPTEEQKTHSRARHRYKKSMMNAQQMYATQWSQYRAQQQTYAQQYEIAKQQYNANWTMLQRGQITPQQWGQYQYQFASKWRQYAYYLQYQQMKSSRSSLMSASMQNLNNVNQMNHGNNNMDIKMMQLYEIALREYPKKDADLWYRWKQSKQQATNIGNVGINNIDKMQCLRIDSKVRQIYDAAHPNEAEQEQQQQQQQRASMTAQQQQAMMYQYQQQLMQQRWSQMNPQQRQQYMVAMQQQQYMRQLSNSNPALLQQQQQQQYYRQLSQRQYMQQMQQQQQQQMQHIESMNDLMASQPLPPSPGGSQPLTQSPNVPPPPPTSLSANNQTAELNAVSSGSRLRGAMESEDKKKERERRRLERKKRRGLQKLKPSAQQQANEKKSNDDV